MSLFPFLPDNSLEAAAMSLIYTSPTGSSAVITYNKVHSAAVIQRLAYWRIVLKECSTAEVLKE